MRELSDMGGGSPLEAIERAVQARAKGLDLDMSAPGSEVELLALIDDEVERWADGARRGSRPVELSQPDLVTERAFRNLRGYGPLTELLDDDDVWEVMINSPAEIFVKRHRGPSGYHHDAFHNDEHVVRTLTRILDDASTSHRKLDPAEGMQDAQLDDGSRMHVVHGDLTRGGHISVNIRRFTGVRYRDLDELVGRGMLDAPAAELLRAAVRARLSIVFAGAPGTGKTTLLSCCAAELDPAWRVVVAEEVFELDIPSPNAVFLQTRPARTDRPAVDLRRLVAGFLRMAPDVAIVGEVRDREALPLMLTLSSGVKGMTTIHAGSARQALTRLRFVCQLADVASPLPMSALNALVTEAVDLVVHCSRGPGGPQVPSGPQVPGGPQVNEIAAVEDLVAGPEATQFTLTPLFARQGPDAPLLPTGLAPQRARAALAAALRDATEGPGTSASGARSPQGQARGVEPR